MARRPIATVDGRELRPLDAAGQPAAPIALGSPAWLRWLEANGSFAYRGPGGGFTARRERRGGRDYWYAYRTSGGRLRKAYLGAAAALSAEQLAAVARRLAASPAPPAAPAQPAPQPHVEAEAPLAARLQPPPADPRLVARPRLSGLLAAHPQARLALVVAPAGYGKTTLVGDWLARSGRPAGWLTIDPADNDAPRFWRYLLAALEPLAPAERRPALAALRAAPPAPAEAALAAALALLGPATGALVLDDYHLIADPAIHRGVAFLIDHLPAGLPLVITARAAPPLPLARLRARGQLIEVDAGALRLSPAETAAFLNEVMGLALSAEQLEALNGRVAGWAAGLRLFALAAPAHADPAEMIAGFGGGHRYVFDYLADEVLRLQPPATQRFLLRTATLDRLSAELCDALLDGGAAPAPTAHRPSSIVLEELERAGLFLAPLDAERRWFRYHPLFAEFLRLRLAEAEPGLPAELHRRAAGWHAANGDEAAAIGHALAGADWPDAAGRIATAAPSLIMRGESTTLRRWVDALPPALARAHPEIGLYMAWALLLDGEIAAIEPWLRAAEERQPSAAGASGELAVVRGGLALFFGDLERAADLVARAHAGLPAGSVFRCVIDYFQGALHELGGDLAAAAAAYVAAADAARATGTVVVGVLAFCSLALLRVAGGGLREAERLYREGLALAVGPDGRPLPPASMAHAGLAILSYAWDDLAAAEAHIQACLEIGEAWGEPDTLLSAQSLRARLLAARGEADAAIRVLDTALAAAPPISGFGGREQVEAERARLDLAAGRLGSAVAWADASGLGVEPRYQPYRHTQYLTVARIWWAQGRAEEARRLLAWLAEQLAAAGRSGDLAEVLAGQAGLLLADGEPEAAQRSLGRALALAEAERPIRVFLDVEPPLDGLLRAVAREPDAAPLRPYIAALLVARRRGASPAAPEHQPAPALIEPLSQREREVLGLLAGGLANRAIAERLVVEVGTVKRHLIAIYRKLDAHSRTEALARARALGLL